MGGCSCSNVAKQNLLPTYIAILSDIYLLVPNDEQQIKFTEKSELMEYNDEYLLSHWQSISPQFTQHVKTLVDHIQDYKIRLIDSAIYVENKIKLATNPIIIKMSTMILVELVANLDSMLVQKGPNMDDIEDDSKILLNFPNLSALQVTDNLLRFELIFSAIISLLISGKQIYNMIWIDPVMSALQSFASVQERQYQSENIHRIIDFMEYTIGYILSRINYTIFDFETLFPLESEDQRALKDMIMSLTDEQQTQMFLTYIETIRMIHIDKFFQTKNQKSLFKQVLLTLHKLREKLQQGNDIERLCQRFVVIFSKRAFLLKTYDELFQAIFQKYDPELWKSSETIQRLIDLSLGVAKREGFLQNVEIFMLSRFLEYINSVETDSKKNIENVQVVKKSKFFQMSNNMVESVIFLGNETKQRIRATVVKEIGYMLCRFESDQFLLFTLELIVKSLLQNLKSYYDNYLMFQETETTLSILLQAVVPDSNAYIQYLNQITNSCYVQYYQIQNGQQVNEVNFEQLISILQMCIQKVVAVILLIQAELFKTVIFLKDELIFTLIQFARYTKNNTTLTQIISLKFRDENKELINVFECSDTAQQLMAYCTITLAHPPNNLRNGMIIIQGVTNSKFLISLCLKVIHGQKYVALRTNRQQEYEINTIPQIGLLIQAILGIIFNEPSKQLVEWAKGELKKFSQYQTLIQIDFEDESLVELEVVRIKLNDLSILAAYLDQQGWTNFEELEKVHSTFMEKLNNQNDEAVEIDEIQIIDNKTNRNSLSQSFYDKNSFQELHDDESFEKMLSQRKKQTNMIF